MELRNYQLPYYDHILNSFNQIECICAPTGAGKSIIFSSAAAYFAKNDNNVIIIVNRVELMYQTKRELSSIGVIPVLLTADTKQKPIGRVMVAMAETLFRRLKKWSFLEYNIAIIDECHRGEFMKLIGYWNRVIGFTATPIFVRKGKSLQDYYQFLYSPIQISDLIRDGWLTTPITYVPANMVHKFKTTMGDYDEKDQGQELIKQKYINTVVKYWSDRKDKNALVFNTTVEHSLAVESALRDAGANVVHVDAGTDKKTRDEIRYRLSEEKGLWVCNVGIYTFGFDSKYIEVVMINRKTKSIPFYNQLAGRGGRILEGKKHFDILDMHGSCIECGKWEEDKNWQYLFTKKKSDKIGVAPVKFCPSCEAVIPQMAMKCDYCGHEFVKPVQEKVFIDDDPNLTVYERKIQSQTKKLIDTAKERGWSKMKPLRDMIFSEINEANRDDRSMNFDVIIDQYIKLGNYKPGMKWWIKNEYLPKLLDEARQRTERLMYNLEKHF